MEIEIEHKILIHVKTQEEDQIVSDLLQKFDIGMIWWPWNN